MSITLHLSTPPRIGDTPYRSGDALTGVLWLTAKQGTANVEIRGVVDLTVRHRTSRLKDIKETKGKGGEEEQRCRAVFASITLDASGEETTFELSLPTDSVDFEEGRGSFAPPPTTNFGDPASEAEVVWAVEVLVEGKVQAREVFKFLPNVQEESAPAVAPDDPSMRDMTSQTSRLRLTSSVLQISHGHLTASIHLAQPHVYERTLPSLHFKLSLSHVAPKGFSLKRHERAKVYGAEVALFARVNREGAKEDKTKTVEEDVLVRKQLIPLTIELDADTPEMDFNLVFDLQSRSGSKTPLQTLPPSFQVPNYSLDYYLRFDLNPAHNQHEEIANIPIVLIGDRDGEREITKGHASKQYDMKEGKPVLD